jgi:hypothetical protein
MGVEIKLTDREFPVSAVFIEFLHRQIEGRPHEAGWHDQLSEVLIPAQAEERRQAAVAVVESIMAHPLGQKAILRSYELLTAILTGQPEKLRPFQDRYRFVCVVGCPRHGGSYLTKQLFLAVGAAPDEVPNAIAHDGFPDAAPFQFRENFNSHIVMSQNMAEYLTMVEIYFANSRLHDNFLMVPKKATKAAYQGAFFHAMLGAETEYLITLRHPVAAAISTYEKSTGLPEGEKFRVRGNIEEWARRDSIHTGADPITLDEQNYFDVYLRYWEQYHLNLALSGLAAAPRRRIVVYGRERMMNIASEYFDRYHSKDKAEEFMVFDNRARHPDWMRKAEPAIRRVAAFWDNAGMKLPLAEMMEAW